jgi:uncharacterized protein YodC (DUF2158 family)
MEQVNAGDWVKIKDQVGPRMRVKWINAAGPRAGQPRAVCFWFVGEAYYETEFPVDWLVLALESQ